MFRSDWETVTSRVGDRDHLTRKAPAESGHVATSTKVCRYTATMVEVEDSAQGSADTCTLQSCCAVSRVGCLKQKGPLRHTHMDLSTQLLSTQQFLLKTMWHSGSWKASRRKIFGRFGSPPAWLLCAMCVWRSSGCSSVGHIVRTLCFNGSPDKSLFFELT